MLTAHPIRLFYLSVRPRAVLEIFTYDMYAPVSPRWPCPDWLRQLRMMRQTFYFSKRAYKKSLHWEAFRRCFPFLFSRASLLESGAKVKKEAENSSIHACITLSGKKRQSCIEKPAPIKVNVLMVLKRKEGD